MTCFDTDFNIVRYKTVGDIMEAFMEKRLPMYEARRLFQLETLTKQITELDAKRRFIQAILDERLVLQKKTDEEIVLGLQACDIPALSDLDHPSAYESYEYVLKMRIDRLKLAAVIELDKQIGEKQGEIDYLSAQTGASLWIQDLDEFQEAWAVYAASRDTESVPAGARADAPKKKVGLKKVVKK
jgi:DNA topoisomerase-2